MDEATEIQEPRLWRRDGWTARIIDNDEDDGWAVAMTRDGDSEPALVGPWTMGRDKKNPKPLDHSAFHTLVKTVTEVLRRHEHAAIARLHRTFSYAADDGQRIRIDLDIVPDDDDPHAILAAFDERTSELLRTARVNPAFKLSATTAQRFVRTGEA
ncbi:MAG: hypothetical protein H0X17_06020 [Deltaproteobacteria bacterium]|nr:hypothetical protein [Deltaproteobacteria bacterium]